MILCMRAKPLSHLIFLFYLPFSPKEDSNHKTIFEKQKNYDSFTKAMERDSIPALTLILQTD